MIPVASIPLEERFLRALVKTLGRDKADALSPQAKARLREIFLAGVSMVSDEITAAGYSGIEKRIWNEAFQEGYERGRHEGYAEGLKTGHRMTAEEEDRAVRRLRPDSDWNSILVPKSGKP